MLIKVSGSFKVLTIAIIISLIASLFMTVDVTADDSPPPLSGEQTDAETEETVPDETVEDILEQLPEDTSIVITTSHGIEPLVTTLAENLILMGDPIWCPDGAPPIPGNGGCSISYANLSTLVYNISEPAANGVIWITSGADTSPSFISIDGSVFTTWSNYNLTIQGGWNGDGVGTITSTTSFSRPIEIVNWSGNVTVNDIVANGVGSTGVSIDTSGDVSLNNLTLNNNDYSGLSVNSGGTIMAENITANDNVSGPGAEFFGTEVILNGTNEFSGNGETGIYVTVTGDITINNLTADNNGFGGYGSGAELTSASGDITLLGSSHFNGNNNTGLVIQANGTINTENLIANDNGAGGNYGSGAELTSASGDVTLSGTNQFNSNFDVGLYIETAGAIDAENITANNNGISGTYGGGAEFLGASLNITGANEFNNNTESGIFADIDGNITLANIVSTGNGNNSNYGVGAELISTGFVEIIGMNVFSSNYSGGLAIYAPIGISILNAEVEDNFDTGLELSSLGNITLNCTTVIGNHGYGVDAVSQSLLLYGSNVSQNTDDDILSTGIISRISNSCFTYPGLSQPNESSETVVLSHPINSLRVTSGNAVSLICGVFSGTIIYLPNGDGAFLPCGFGDSARLIEMNMGLIPNMLPRGNKFVTGFELVVLNNNKPLLPLGDEGSIWHWNFETDGEIETPQAYFWDGSNWINADLTSFPFMRIFFLVPEGLKESNLAILFWDGSTWIELTDALNLGQGRFVTKGGHLNANYFEAELNFIGTFVLVEK